MKPKVLAQCAKHDKTGEVIPQELVTAAATILLMYKNFRGKEAGIEPLLRSRGLLAD